MPDTPHASITRIVARASFIHERLDTPSFAPVEAPEPAVVERRWRQWSAQMGAAGDAGLERRLEWAGWNTERSRQVLGGVTLRADARLPAWTHTLFAMWEAFERSTERVGDVADVRARICLADAPVAFEDAMLPFVLSARDRLNERAPRATETTTAEAITGCERQLLVRLSSLASDVLLVALQARRAVAAALRVGARADDTLTSEYARLVHDLVTGEWRDVFTDYPVLARLMATAVEQWIHTTSELLARIRSDAPAIAATVGLCRDVGRAVAIASGASDAHDGGRTSAFVRFEDGTEVVYKPKSVAAEAAFADLVAWVNARGANPPLRAYRVLDRGSYGWVERVPHRACDSEDEVGRYYERAGMLLALLHSLAATDAHADNIVACGEYPVLVDMETLQTPLVRENAGPGAVADADRKTIEEVFDDSVLATQLLPEWELGPGDKVFERGGFVGHASFAPTRAVAGYHHINSDAMRAATLPVLVEARSNVVALHGAPRAAPEYRERIGTGFKAMYALLARERTHLLAPGGPLAVFAALPVRVLMRTTNVYATLIADLRRPDLLRDGTDASLHLEALARAHVGETRRPHTWPLLSDELRALARGDVPRYVTPAGGTTLRLASGTAFDDFLAKPGHARMRDRLDRLSPADLDTQCALIDGALRVFERKDRVAPRNSTTLSPTDWVTFARAVAERLRHAAIVGSDGSATWLTLAFVDRHRHMRLEPMRHRLYDGQTGIALFLAALVAVTGDAAYRRLALAALAPLRTRTRAGISAIDAATQGLGACTGLGSGIYALARCAAWLDEPALIDDAHRLAALITPDLVAVERNPDVMSGVAGAVLALLALHRVTPSRDALERATACGERLLEMRVVIDATAAGWPVADRLPALTGMGHGAAGIALALARLGAATRRGEFARAAEQAIELERRHFVPDAGNWADLRVAVEPGAPQATFVGWCAGAPGIAIARLGGLAAMDTPEIGREIEVALATTRAAGLQPEHHLCCGTMGLVDALLEGARRLDGPDLRSAAERAAASVVAAAAEEVETNDALAMTAGGLFRGLAGVGYECLRLADATRVPSVLSFD